MASSGFENIAKIPELKRRIGWVLILLAVYRIGVFIPTAGIDGARLKSFIGQQSGTLFGLFNMFSGGSFQRFSIFTLGIMPYISSSIIFSLLTAVIPSLEAMQKEGEAGRKKITRYTRYGTVLLSVIQGFGISVWLESLQVGNMGVVNEPGWGFRLMTILTLTAGTSFLMWIGEQINEHGIGNGISLIIFAGIVASIPSALRNTFQLFQNNELQFFTLLFLIALMVVVIAAIIYFETAQRRIPIQYAKKVVGRKVYAGQSTHLPLKINSSGVIPPIFASSILLFPATLASFIELPFISQLQSSLQPGSLFYNVVFVSLIIFFCFFYTALQINPNDMADNLKKYGGYIPGIRPGKKTAEFIDRVLSRVTTGGAIYLCVVCVLPTILITKLNVPFYFGGTALLIVIGVALDTISQIESHLLTHQYEGFMGGGTRSRRLRGRKG